MATERAEAPEPWRRVQVAVLAKAPIPGLAKTRLIPALGPSGAARLQRWLTRRALQTASDAALGPVTLWCAPDTGHRFFRALQRTTGLPCLAQLPGDLGARMDAAFRRHSAQGPLLLIGTDGPALRPAHLRRAAQALVAGDDDGGIEGHDAVFHPAEDGGYVLIGLRWPQPALFVDMPWSTDEVMARTRQRAMALGLRVHEAETLWDVDRPADLRRLRALTSRRWG